MIKINDGCVRNESSHATAAKLAKEEQDRKISRSSSWFAIALGQPLLNGNHMKSSDGDASVVIEPHNHTGPSRIDTGVIGPRHGVAFAAARDNREELERSRSKVPSNIADHAFEYSSAR